MLLVTASASFGGTAFPTIMFTSVLVSQKWYAPLNDYSASPSLIDMHM
jgi:hypothetical protein